MGIKQIIIIASAAVVSFGGAFVAAWVTRPSPATGSEPNISAGQLQRLQAELGIIRQVPRIDIEDQRQRALAEEQVRGLIRQLQEKIREYQQKLQGLELKQQQTEQVSQQVSEQIKRLEDLRVELAAAVANLRAQRDQLDRTRLRIDQAEQANLKVLAATYDKMDSDSAAKLLVSMCKARPLGGIDRATNIEDAVRILYYMNEKKRATVLGSMIQVDPDLAAYLSLRLKQVMED